MKLRRKKKRNFKSHCHRKWKKWTQKQSNMICIKEDRKKEKAKYKNKKIIENRRNNSDILTSHFDTSQLKDWTGSWMDG